MLTYIIRRVLLMFPTLIGVTAVVFFVMAYAPGGFGAALDQGGAQSEGKDARRLKKAMERRYGSNLPKPVQYGRWLNQVSPVGFRMSGDIEPTDEDVERVSMLLVNEAFNTHPTYLRRAAETVLAFSAYMQKPAGEVAGHFQEQLKDPAKAFDLFDLIDAAPLDPDDLKEEVEELEKSRGLGRAQNRMIEELAFEVSGRSRMLLAQPTLKTPDLGESLQGRKVTDLIAERLPVTLLLNLIAIPVIYVVSIVVGLKAACNRGGFFDVTSGFLTIGLWSIPTIWAGMLFISYLANTQYLQWFPTGQLHDAQADQMAWWPTWGSDGFERGYLLDTLWHLVLPVVCLSYTGFAVISKVMRGAILDNLSADYVRTARAKGVTERVVLWSHIFRNSILPLITMFAGILPALFVGSVVVEWIFSIPGMGDLGLRAAYQKDREIIMATVLIGGLLKLFSEVLRDVCYAVVDPRVSYE